MPYNEPTYRTALSLKQLKSLELLVSTEVSRIGEFQDESDYNKSIEEINVLVSKRLSKAKEQQQ